MKKIIGVALILVVVLFALPFVVRAGPGHRPGPPAHGPGRRLPSPTAATPSG